MKKLFLILVLGLVWGGSVYSKDFIDSNIIIEKFLETEKNSNKNQLQEKCLSKLISYAQIFNYKDGTTSVKAKVENYNDMSTVGTIYLFVNDKLHNQMKFYVKPNEFVEKIFSPMPLVPEAIISLKIGCDINKYWT